MMRMHHKQQKMLLTWGIAALAALLLLGAFHVHEGEGGSPCWYCVAVSGALLPILAVLLAPLRTVAPHPPEVTREPSWFRWVIHHRRGPPHSV